MPLPVSPPVPSKGLLDRVEAATNNGSALSRWMSRHYDRLDRAFSGSRVQWAEVAELLAEEEGLLDRRGKPHTPQTVKRTWFRVRERVRKRREKAASRTPTAFPQVRDALPLIPERLEPEPDPDAAKQVRAKIERLNKSLNR